ncbi:cwf18 pre-mRNA splicing factor-domain-containing protein [Lophiotrema nucula]|uniref:Cwf18 pre-mRNA splicing factor-domain-containing protein n=1 Tax=Lophiotrema nucula TaxID=690887 RepID=A0A6A5ZDK2_9PLEO|nr:cwf18 pre-mRNA splicing factor-domain-containing protein [Lophiotrema nucula]
MSSHETLSAASNDRKARLAQLKSLKRKAPPTDDSEPASTTDSTALTVPSTSTDLTRSKSPDIAATILSGRNYDPETRNAKLGFASPPPGANSANTLEAKAAELAIATKEQQAKEAADDKGLDFTKLQPKKPNWDLKRDYEAKVREGGLDVQLENAIARLVRERVEARKKEREVKVGKVRGEGDEEGQEVGMEGSELVEAMHLKEREDEEERRRDADEEEEAEGDVS